MKITKSNLQDVFKCKQESKETLILKGYKEIKSFFVDNSGFGSETESALTPANFLKELESLLNEYPQGVYCFLTDCGQFQVYITAFIKGKKPLQSKRIAPNTLEIFKDNQRVIRFWNTDILIFNQDNTKVKVFNGGYFTSTTKDRLNKFLPSFKVYQHKREWYLTKGAFKPKQDIKFFEGIELSV